MTSTPPIPPPKDIKITYFDIQGAAEASRLSLVIAKIPFTDERVNREGMNALKDAGKLPCGQLPIMEVDGKSMCQSEAMARYLGKLCNTYPNDPWMAAKVDEITQFINQDIRERCIYPSFREKDSVKKADMRKVLAEETLPAKFKVLESYLSSSGFFVGESVTLADLNAYVLFNWIGMEVLDGIPKEVVLNFPSLQNLCRKINEIPEVSEWNASKNGGKIPWF
eukprot:GSMAST32.ASY1.ANO1.1498.1 assembled CDS